MTAVVELQRIGGLGGFVTGPSAKKWAPDIFERDVSKNQSQAQQQGTEPKLPQHRQYLIQLVVEKHSCNDVEGSVKERTQAVEQKKTGGPYAECPG